MVRVLAKGFVEPYPEEILWMLFKPFGTVNYIKIKENSAIIDYSSREEADSAICNLQFRKLSNSSILILDLFYDPEKRVVLKNAHPRKQIEQAMTQFGRIHNVKETPGLIYVDYCDRESANKVVDHMLVVMENNGLVLVSNQLENERQQSTRFRATKNERAMNIPKKVGEYSQGEEGVKSTKDVRKTLKISKLPSCCENDCQTIFIYNLSRKVSEGDLYDFFGKYGDIISCGIKGERGFINYTSKEAALRAFKYMNGKVVKNERIRVKIKP